MTTTQARSTTHNQSRQRDPSPAGPEARKRRIKAAQTVRPGFDGPPSDPPPLEFQLSDPERMRTVLADTGLGEVNVDTITETPEFRDGRELWTWLISSNPIVERVPAGLDLTNDEREKPCNRRSASWSPSAPVKGSGQIDQPEQYRYRDQVTTGASRRDGTGRP